MLRLSPKTWFAFAVANFLAFGFVSTMIGGDALNGRILNGEFFIGLHGRYTRVTEQRYLVCLIWELGTFAGLFLAWHNQRKNKLRP